MARIVLGFAADAAPVEPPPHARWIHADSGHYLRIAVDGYASFPCPPVMSTEGKWCGNAAWLPGYPLLVRATRLLGVENRRGPLGRAAVVVSAAFTLAGLCALWIGRLRSEAPARGLLALGLAAFFPGSIYAHAVFPLAPFGLFTTLALLLAARGREWGAGLAAAAAAFTYPLGALLAPTLALFFWFDGSGALIRRLLRGLVAGFLAACGAAAVLVVQRFYTGSWLAFALAQGSYTYTMTGALRTIYERIRPLWEPPFEGAWEAIGAQTLFVFVLVAAAVLAVGRAARRSAPGLGPLEHVTVLACLGFWVLPLITGEVGTGLHRREGALLPLVLVTVRLPAPLQAAFLAAAVAIAYPMALLFFRDLLV